MSSVPSPNGCGRTACGCGLMNGCSRQAITSGEDEEGLEHSRVLVLCSKQSSSRASTWSVRHWRDKALRQPA